MSLLLSFKDLELYTQFFFFFKKVIGCSQGISLLNNNNNNNNETRKITKIFCVFRFKNV